MSVSVIGAGISGLSIALHLLERDLGPVTIYERTGIGSGASGIQPGGVRRQWGARASCLMAQESFSFWRAFGEPFTECGYLFLADEQATARPASKPGSLCSTHSTSRRGCSRLLLRSMVVPGLEAAGVLGAAWCAEDGYFDRPQAVVERFAREVGSRIEVSGVDNVAANGAGWRLELASGGAVSSDVVVVAAGAETRALVAPLGFELPIVEESRTLLLSAPIRERLLEPLVIAIDRGIAAKQLADGRVLASDLRDQGRDWRRRLHELLPMLEFVALPIVATGAYDMTPDGQPIIDALADGLWVAAGFQRARVMVAPSTGRLVADGLAGAELPEWRNAVRADRFRDAVEVEAQVI